MTVENIACSITNLHERMLPVPVGIDPRPPGHIRLNHEAGFIISARARARVRVCVRPYRNLLSCKYHDKKWSA